MIYFWEDGHKCVIDIVQWKYTILDIACKKNIIEKFQEIYKAEFKFFRTRQFCSTCTYSIYSNITQ